MSYYIAFWNVENLFDVKDSPRRSDKLQRVLKNELSGWTQTVLDRKLQQLAWAISRMNDGQGPDMLGLAEIENRLVLEKLLTKLQTLMRNYKIAHADTSDHRGIDVAFIYDGDLFTAREQFSHYIQKRTATRDLFQVNFENKTGKQMIVIGNHWPSRLGGQYASAPFRMMAGETLAYFHKRIREIHGTNVAVLAMGDFNDEPFDRSLREYARAKRLRASVTSAHSAKFLNLMWPLMGSGSGSYFLNNHPLVLDQFLVSKGLLTGKSGFEIDVKKTQIFRQPLMINRGRYHTPRRFGRGRKMDKDGFSDHFPISSIVKET